VITGTFLKMSVAHRSWRLGALSRKLQSTRSVRLRVRRDVGSSAIPEITVNAISTFKGEEGCMIRVIHMVP
jgi:hypothetical protein